MGTIERLHEEFRRRVKTQGSLPTEDAAASWRAGRSSCGWPRLRGQPRATRRQYYGADLSGNRFGLQGTATSAEAVPSVSRVALLLDRPTESSERRETEAAARSLGVQLERFSLRSGDEFDAAFAPVARNRVGGAVIQTGIVTFADRS